MYNEFTKEFMKTVFPLLEQTINQRVEEVCKEQAKWHVRQEVHDYFANEIHTAVLKRVESLLSIDIRVNTP